MVQSAYELHQPDLVYAGIIAIGVAAFLFRFLLTLLEKVLFPWRQVQAGGTSVAVPSAKHSKAVTRGN